MKKLIFFLTLILISNLLISKQSKDIEIIEKPIVYNKERERLSVEYLKERNGIIQEKPNIIPKIIVLHYTTSGKIKTNFNYFNNIQIESSRKINKDQSLLNVSAHYLIDRDGTIYHLVVDNLFARHTIGLNYCSIGVENIGSKKEPFTSKQVIANANLIRHLCKNYKIKYVIGYSEYTKFRKKNLWKETNPNYITYKEDPGNEFLIDVRKLISDLNLKSKP